MSIDSPSSTEWSKYWEDQQAIYGTTIDFDAFSESQEPDSSNFSQDQAVSAVFHSQVNPSSIPSIAPLSPPLSPIRNSAQPVVHPPAPQPTIKATQSVPSHTNANIYSSALSSGPFSPLLYLPMDYYYDRLNQDGLTNHVASSSLIPFAASSSASSSSSLSSYHIEEQQQFKEQGNAVQANDPSAPPAVSAHAKPTTTSYHKAPKNPKQRFTPASTPAAILTTTGSSQNTNSLSPAASVSITSTSVVSTASQNSTSLPVTIAIPLLNDLQLDMLLKHDLQLATLLKNVTDLLNKAGRRPDKTIMSSDWLNILRQIDKIEVPPSGTKTDQCRKLDCAHKLPKGKSRKLTTKMVDAIEAYLKQQALTNYEAERTRAAISTRLAPICSKCHYRGQK